MKKLLSIVLVAFMLFTLGMSVFAAEYMSPDNPHNIEIVDDNPGGHVSYEYDEETDTYKFSADVEEGYHFVHYYIIGEYELISGSLEDPYIVVKLKDGSEVHAVYDEGSELYATVANGSEGGEASVKKVEYAVFKYSASVDSGYKFVKWVFTGDYEIISGSLTSAEITVRAKSDVHGIAYWDGASKDNKSPKTGYETVAMTAIVLVALAGAAFAFKKFENE